jgi:hypothetical protein
MGGLKVKEGVTVECFRRRRFREASLSLIEALSEIASNYADDGLKLTVRQLYYQCVARGWIENNEREYQTSTSSVAKVRCAQEQARRCVRGRLNRALRVPPTP